MKITYPRGTLARIKASQTNHDTLLTGLCPNVLRLIRVAMHKSKQGEKEKWKRNRKQAKMD